MDMTNVIGFAEAAKPVDAAPKTAILRKGYEAITIQDIIDEADVGRSTFYAHYTGKEDLLRGGFKTLRMQMADAQRTAPVKSHGSPDETLGFSLAMFEHAGEYKQVYRALVGGRG